METRYISLEDAIDTAKFYEAECDPIPRLIDSLNFIEPADVVPAPRWISVDERLPEEGEFVLIYVGEIQVARLEKGISIADRNRMKKGVIADPIVGYSDFDKRPVKRSDVFKRCDEQGNNKVSYIWIANGGPMQWFGQYATHWMPLPQPPKEGGKGDA